MVALNMTCKFHTSSFSHRFFMIPFFIYRQLVIYIDYLTRRDIFLFFFCVIIAKLFHKEDIL